MSEQPKRRLIVILKVDAESLRALAARSGTDAIKGFRDSMDEDAADEEDSQPTKVVLKIEKPARYGLDGE